MLRRSAVIGLMALALPPTLAQAQATRRLVGDAVSGESGTGVGDAVVEVLGTTLRTSTGPSGRFAFPAAPVRSLAVRAVRVGFHPATETVAAGSPGDTATVLLRLEPADVVVEPVVVTAARHALLAEDAPTSVSVATAADLARRGTIGLDEAVARVPGVQILDGQVTVRGSTGYAKGVGSRVLLLVDGVPATQGDRGGINWDLLPLTEVARVEILKGTGSALYGSAALGGVVNLITRDIPERPDLRARLLAGGYADPPPEWRWRGSRATFGGADIALTRRVGPVGVLLSGGAFGNAGYRENNDDARYRTFTKLTYAGGQTFRAALSAAAVREDYGAVTLWCVQGRCADRGLAYQPFRVDSATRGDRTVSDKYFVQATAQRVVSSRLALRTRLSWYRTRFADRFRVDPHRSTADRLGYDIGGEWHASAARTLSAGTEGAFSRVRSDIFGDHSQAELAGYAEGETPLARGAHATLGVRLDAIAVDRGAWTAFASPRLGAVWRLPPVRLRASLGRGFRAPALAERFVATTLQGIRVIPNPDLRSETSWSGEVGVNLAPLRTAVLDAAVFWNAYDDLIEPGFVSGGSEIQFRNVTKARVGGLDVGASASALRGRLDLTLAYTYLDTRNLTTRNRLPFRPKHLATLGADVAIRRFTVGFEGRASSRPELVGIYESDRRVAARTLDVRAGWDRGDYGVRAKVENVFNYTYTLVPRTLEKPRTYSLIVTLR